MVEEVIYFLVVVFVMYICVEEFVFRFIIFIIICLWNRFIYYVMFVYNCMFCLNNMCLFYLVVLSIYLIYLNGLYFFKCDFVVYYVFLKFKFKK